MMLPVKSLKDNIHRHFQDKKAKYSFNCLGQKRLYLISSTTNSTALAVIFLAHLEELLCEGLPICVQAVSMLILQNVF